ncbi:MAG: hypothetical protein KZQ73_03940 [Candidatus Thiodiazotropha sp. (ex Semelilucina semeliformis)]|nr:hypothetical protein [Candidatus Thiodiazotropha sp. (ex Semelilucina semeliformis)]
MFEHLLNSPEYDFIKDQLENFIEKTGFSEEQIQAIITSPIHDSFVELYEDETIEELERSALLTLTTDKSIELLESATNSDFLLEEIGKFIEGAGIDVQIALESINNEAVKIDLDRAYTNVPMDTEDQFFETFKNTGADIGTAAKILADKLDRPKSPSNLTENIAKRVGSFVELVEQTRNKDRFR